MQRLKQKLKSMDSLRPLLKVVNVIRDMPRLVGIKYNDIEAAYYDWKSGTETAGRIPLDRLDIDYGSVKHGKHYQPVNAHAFRKTMRSIRIANNESVFIDFGCGKGKSLLLASDFDFIRKSIGIEFSRELCICAERNASRFSRSYGRRSIIEVVHADAVNYDIPSDANIFFFYNPFDKTIMVPVLKRISRSLSDSPRPSWLIYCNPVHREAMAEVPEFKFEREYSFLGPGRNFAVYSANPVRRHVDGDQQP